MSLDRATLTEHLLERIYDVLWKTSFIQEDCELEEFKSILRADIIIQLDMIENELWASNASKIGSVKTEKKASSSRENGKLGGRPRKKQ